MFVAALGLLCVIGSLCLCQTILLMADLSTMESILLFHEKGVLPALMEIVSRGLEFPCLKEGSRLKTIARG